MLIDFNIEQFDSCKLGAYSISWDDMSKTSLYEIANQGILYNIPHTFYINFKNDEWNTNLFVGLDNKNTTIWEFNNIIKQRLIKLNQNGHEIGNHTYSHMKIQNITTDVIRNYTYMKNQNRRKALIFKEIAKCSKAIRKITNKKDLTFSYPFGNKDINKSIYNYIKDNFISSRCADYPKNLKDSYNYINTYDNLNNMHNLKSIHIGCYKYKKSINELNNLINMTISKMGWLIEYGHGCNNDAWKPIEFDTLVKHYKYINSMKKMLWCDTILNISKYIIQHKQIKLIIQKNENDIIIKFDNINFNHEVIPLTISLKSKINLHNLKILQNNKELILNNNNSNYYFKTLDFTNEIYVQYK